MKRIIKYHFILLMFLVITTLLNGQVIYTDFEPDIVINPGMPSMYQFTTKEFFEFDIDQDSINDYKLYSERELYNQSPSSGYADGYYTSISVLDTNNRVSYKNSSAMLNCSANYQDSGKIIDYNMIWAKGAWFSEKYLSGEWISCSSPGTKKYYPVKLCKNSLNYYGWVRLKVESSRLTLYDMAINLTPDEPINTGQINAISEIDIGIKLNIFPNPAKTSFVIIVPDGIIDLNDIFIQIFNSTGSLVKYNKTIISDNKVKIDLCNQSKGIYNVVLTNGKKSYGGRIVFE